MRNFNPNELETKKVQVWANDIMLTLIPLEEARELVKSHKYFVITCQAINYNEQGQNNGFNLVGNNSDVYLYDVDAI